MDRYHPKVTLEVTLKRKMFKLVFMQVFNKNNPSFDF